MNKCAVVLNITFWQGRGQRIQSTKLEWSFMSGATVISCSFKEWLRSESVFAVSGLSSAEVTVEGLEAAGIQLSTFPHWLQHTFDSQNICQGRPLHCPLCTSWGPHACSSLWTHAQYFSKWYFILLQSCVVWEFEWWMVSVHSALHSL